MEAQPDGSLLSVLDGALSGLRRARSAAEAPAGRPRDVGVVRTVASGIARVSGLPKVGFQELVQFRGGLPGIAFNIDEEEIGVVILGETSEVFAGQEVERTGRVMDAQVGDGLIGSVIDPAGRPLDGRDAVRFERRLPIEREAPAIMDREPVNIPLQTGHQGDRRAHPDRTRPARADSRRPPDRQDSNRSRHGRQSKGPGRGLHLLLHRPARSRGRERD